MPFACWKTVSSMRLREERYVGWSAGLGKAILAGELDLAALSRRVDEAGLEPEPVSGRQERLENLVNRYL